MKKIEISVTGIETATINREVPDMLCEFLMEIARDLNASHQPDFSPIVDVQIVDSFKIYKEEE